MLPDLLRQWLPRQRWFAGKDRGIDEITIVADVELVAGDPGLRHVIVAVRQGAVVDRYQVPVGLRRGRLPDRLEYACLGRDGGRYVYDAVHDHELTRVLLEAMAAGVDVGPLRFRSLGELATGLQSLASPAEQTNTSLIYGDAYICKLFRRLAPGINPDLELNLGLSRAGCKHTPALYGWMAAELDGGPVTLGMLSEFLRTGSDGWALAAASVRDLYAEPGLAPDEVGGDFAGESERLGRATAAVHHDLAAAFGVGQLTPAQVRELAEGMRTRLAAACQAVPELATHAPRLTRAYDELAALDEPLATQRIHGDFHLGQAMRTELGWMLLDFEGEPARPVAERRTPTHPLRDVAAMLRSYDYAARHQLTNSHATAADPHLQTRAHQWAQHNRTAFCRGYAEAGGTDPSGHQTVLRAFEYDKAVYEVLYEARHRPAWLHIPLGSIAAL